MKADDFLERNGRYLRPVGFVLFFVVAGLAIEYLFATIVSIYFLGTLIGVQNLQLVIGAISAAGTLASGGVAVFLYRNSVRGADISVAVEDLLEPDTEYRIRKTLATSVPTETTQELFEKLHFDFPIVWLNTGPKGGAVTNVELKLVKPVSHFPTILKDSEGSEDNISVLWDMEIAKPEERIPLNSVRLPVFSSGSQNSMSIGDNQSIAVTAKVDLFLMDKKKDMRPPQNTWLKIQQDTPYFEFKIQWKTATKSGLKPNERSFKIRPKFGEPIQEGPAVTVA